MAMCLPYGVADLIVRGAWKEMLALARWHGRSRQKGRKVFKTLLLPDFPSQDWLASVSPSNDCFRPDMPSLSPHSMLNLIEQLKYASQSTVENSDNQPLLAAAFQAASCLSAWSADMQHGSESGCAGTLQIHKARINAEALLHSVRLALSFRGGAEHVRDIVESAVRLVLPAGICQSIQTSLDAKMLKLPSKSSIKRHYFCLDMALCFYLSVPRSMRWSCVRDRDYDCPNSI